MNEVNVDLHIGARKMLEKARELSFFFVFFLEVFFFFFLFRFFLFFWSGFATSVLENCSKIARKMLEIARKMLEIARKMLENALK